MRTLLKSIGLCLICLSVMCGLASADLTYTDTNVGGPSWDRPFADGGCCSGLGPVVYHAQEFFVNSDGTIDVSSVQDGYDGYILLYKDAFDPLDQSANFVAGDDDGSGGIGTSDIESVPVTAGPHFLVTTGFAAGDEGTFVNTITGDVSLSVIPTSIPTLSEWGMIILVLLLLFIGTIVLRRKRDVYC